MKSFLFFLCVLFYIYYVKSHEFPHKEKDNRAAQNSANAFASENVKHKFREGHDFIGVNSNNESVLLMDDNQINANISDAKDEPISILFEEPYQLKDDEEWPEVCFCNIAPANNVFSRLYIH